MRGSVDIPEVNMTDNEFKACVAAPSPSPLTWQQNCSHPPPQTPPRPKLAHYDSLKETGIHHSETRR